MEIITQAMPSTPDIPALHAKAEAGDAAAQAQLGAAYFEGQGVRPNYAEAYFWFLLADAAGYKTARAQADKAAAKLRDAERAYAEKLAARWKPPSSAVQESPQAPVKTTPPLSPKNKVAVGIAVAILIIFSRP